MKFWNKSYADPIRGLSLERLAQQIDSYNTGHIGEFALTAEAMEQRDDLLRNVILKRKKAVARHPWEVLAADDSPEAHAHKQALDYFYNNLRCTHVLKQDLQGGFNLLVHQMMDAIAKGWAVHEITWKPTVARPSPAAGSAGAPSPVANAGHPLPHSAEGTDPQSAIRNLQSSMPLGLSAELRFIPLWYFENTAGRLRLLSRPFAFRGEPLEPREWLVTTADALMPACARAFLFKHFPLQAWLDYCQKYGTPGLRGVTGAARNTADWTAMEQTLDTFMEELAVVTNSAENIELIDLKGHGQAPFADLVERMDRAMASLWRGADLSTISRDRGYGASLQEAEARLIEADDAEMISGTLNQTLDRWVIQYHFGKAAVPRAYMKILVAPKECTPNDLAIDEFLVRHGARLSLAKTLERYGRAPARGGEPALEILNSKF